MAPELCEEEYNELVDVYSFACACSRCSPTSNGQRGSNLPRFTRRLTSVMRLPDAFHKLHDTEARRFIGRCLEKRPEALTRNMADAFLQCEDHRCYANSDSPCVEA
ncbi:hypothetical protein HPP92_007321 [Vanilla planifolia]|uniref:non-specific serine/threonine protein kinase n=1 Tax=Vanilla planifolia TaxID=51239 RepID=A0A835RQM6_VANPL|nr:hypothetical protein HPP92_007526 [Vanilla planifolia]KAG0490458.1 hypothetical protein HPP92_007321 [Vanilla planifolia]